MPDPVPTSENHNLPKIPPLDSQYEDEWGFVYNDGEFADGSDAGSDALVQALDERTPIVDTAANRSEYFPYADALFIASDTGQVSLGDGESWSSRGVVPNDSDVLDAIDGADISPNLVDANQVSVEQQSTEKVIDEITSDGSGVQTVDDGVETVVEFDTVVENQLGGANTTDNRIDIQQAGKYLLFAKVRPDDDLTDLRLDIRVNGSARIREHNRQGINRFAHHTAQDSVTLSAGDEIDAVVDGNIEGESTFDLRKDDESNYALTAVRLG